MSTGVRADAETQPDPALAAAVEAAARLPGADIAGVLLTDDAGLAADVADAEDVERAVGRVAAEFGRIDLLFNNAGITGTRAAARCHETRIGEWDRVVG